MKTLILILIAATAPAQTSDPAEDAARNTLATAKVWLAQATESVSNVFLVKDNQIAALQTQHVADAAQIADLQAKLDAALTSQAPDPVISKIKTLPGAYPQMALVTSGPTIAYWFPAPGGDSTTPPQQVCFARNVPVVSQP